MPKSGYITARVEPALKKSAQTVLRRGGLTTTEAITLFLHQDREFVATRNSWGRRPFER